MASFPQTNNIINLPAAISLGQFKAVKVVNNAGVDSILLCSAGDAAVGFTMNSPAAGEICEIASIGGGAKATAGGTITAGAFLAVGAGSNVIVATVNDIVVGRALESAVSGDIFAIEPLTAFSGTSTV